MFEGGFRNRSCTSLPGLEFRDDISPAKYDIKSKPSLYRFRVKWIYLLIIPWIGPVLLFLLLTISEISWDFLSNYSSLDKFVTQIDISQRWKPCTSSNINSVKKLKSQTTPVTVKTKGMVACASPINQNIYDLTVLLIYMKKAFGSVLPMEIYHVNEVEPNMIKNIVRLSRLNGVEVYVIDISEILEKKGIMRDRWKYFQSFHCKPIALAHSCFDEIILFDRDIIPLQDLQRLFELHVYKESGALFFHDFRFNMSTGRNRVSPDRVRKIYSTLNANLKRSQNTINNVLFESNPWLNISTDVQDSSIVVLDRTRHKGMMEILMSIYSDPSLIEALCGKRGKRRGFFIDEWIHGDKELYWLAATLANESVSFSPWSASVYNPCENIMAQYDPATEKDPAIMWINGNKYWQMMPVINSRGVGCPRLFNSNLKFGKRCEEDLCYLRQIEVESLLRFKFFFCRANLLTSQLCWPLTLGFSMDWLNPVIFKMGPVWRNFKWYRIDMLNI